MKANGPQQRQLTHLEPNGSRIAHLSVATGSGDIYVMGADRSHQTRLTTDPARDPGPVWSPDRTQDRVPEHPGHPSRPNVYLTNADGSHQHPVHPGGVQFGAPSAPGL